MQQRGTRPSDQDTGRSDGADRLATLFSSFAREVQQERDPESTLAEIVRAAIVLVPGCDEASVSIICRGRSVVSRAASGELPRVVDALQESTKQGPCLSAVFDQETVRVPDLADEDRWPLFSAGAREAGAAGMLCFQLYVQGDNLGALNLISRVAGAFTDESEHVGRLFAAHAAIALSASQQHDRMVRAVATQQLIGQAQGILMERHKVTDQEAFSMLVRVSQDSNTKLRDIAGRLVSSGELALGDRRSPARHPS